MRRSREQPTDRIVISLNDGRINFSENFTTDWEFSTGSFQKSFTTDKGVKIIVQGVFSEDGKSTQLYVTFEKSKGFSRTDLIDATEFVNGLGVKARKVDLPANGFIHDDLNSSLIEGINTKKSFTSSPDEKPQIRDVKKRRFPFTLPRFQKKQKLADEKQKQQLIEANDHLIKALDKKRNDLFIAVGKLSKPERSEESVVVVQGLFEHTSNLLTDRSQKKMSMDELRTLNHRLSAGLSSVTPLIPTPGKSNTASTMETKIDTVKLGQVLNDLYRGIDDIGKSTPVPPMVKAHQAEVKKHAYEERIEKMKVAAEGNDKLLAKIDKYGDFLKKSGLINKPEASSIIEGELAKLEKHCKQFLSIKGKQAPEPPTKK